MADDCRGTNTRGTSILWLSDSHRERPQRDVQLASGALHQGQRPERQDVQGRSQLCSARASDAKIKLPPLSESPLSPELLPTDVWIFLRQTQLRQMKKMHIQA